MTIIDHGIPVSSSRQWTTGLARNAANTGWNYIVCAFDGAAGVPVEWVVISDLTGTPTQAIYNGPTHLYATSTFQIYNQLRAPNGRIFFPLFGPATAYYDPTDEQVHQLGQITESPAQNPNASTAFYSSSFDTAGLLYLGSQESANRPACIVVTNPTTLVQTIIGYVGDSNAIGYTTYGYRLAPDTGTATKWIYVAFGENPWQLWALNITTGVATKLYEVPATGNIQFADIVGQGWTAIMDTNLGQPSNVRTQLWCLDGATYAYTVGVAPPVTARNVTPATNPLTGTPPDLDTGGGVGVVGWRFGTTGPYTYVNYTVNYTNPVAVESLITSSPNNGIVGNAQQYSGFFQYAEPADTKVWYGPFTNGGVSRGPRLNVGGTIYIAGYPNGVLLKYDPTAAWNSNGNINPFLIGYYGLNGTQFAGIKYADFLAWGAGAGATGRLYCSGSRERNGVGSGIGYWDKTANVFAGTYAAPGMDTVLSSGLCVLPGISRVVMATYALSGSGDAALYVFDYDLNYVTQLTPLTGHLTLGAILETSTPNVIAGVVQGSGNSIGLYKYNVQTQTLVTYTEIAIIGTLGASCVQIGAKVWMMSAGNLVSVDLNALTAGVVQDLSSILPVKQMAFASDGHTLFMAAGSPSGVDGAQIYSVDTGSALAADAGIGIGVGFAATLALNGNVVLLAGVGAGVGVGNDAALFFNAGINNGPSGSLTVLLRSNEAGLIIRGQPVYSDGDGTVRLACADGSGASRVVGIVDTYSLSLGNVGEVCLEGSVAASPAQWDTIAGTTGGLVFGVIYYLSPTTPGRLTATPPTATGSEIVPVLRGLSSTRALVIINPSIAL